MKVIECYTDGGCRGNGKSNSIGGYGIVLLYKDTKKEIRKAFRGVTNNAMELSSIVDALSMLKEPCRVNVYSDSAYVVNAINQNWIYKWQQNGWRTQSKEAVKNKELWERLLFFMSKHEVHFIKVKGHASCELNNRCDELANIAMDELIASGM